MTDDISWKPLVTSAVTLPKDLTTGDLAAIAKEVAINMRDLPTILAEHGLTPAQYKIIEQVPYYKQAVEVLAKEWNSPRSTADRIALQALAGLEQGTTKLATRLTNPHESLSAVAAIADIFMQLGRLKGQQQSAPSSEKFVIQIDLGGDQRITIDTARFVEDTAKAMALEPLPENEGSESPLPELAEREGSPAPVEHEPETQSSSAPLPTFPEGHNRGGSLPAFNASARLATGLRLEPEGESD